MRQVTTNLLKTYDLVLEEAAKKAAHLETLVESYRKLTFDALHEAMSQMHLADEERLSLSFSGYACSLRFKGSTMVKVAVDNRFGEVVVAIDGEIIYSVKVGEDALSSFSPESVEIGTAKKHMLECFARNLTTHRNKEIEKL